MSEFVNNMSSDSDSDSDYQIQFDYDDEDDIYFDEDNPTFNVLSATIDNGDCVFGLRAESDNVELLGDLLIPSAAGEKETYWHSFYYQFF